MAFILDHTKIAHAAVDDKVRSAAHTAKAVIDLWPLTLAQHMTNDTQYGETLQVRLTRCIAKLLTGEDVTIPDAEFVYEGADEIPGRPQHIVDVLLAANDACDMMSSYSQTGDTTVIMAAAGDLKVAWNDDTIHALAEAFESVEQQAVAGAADVIAHAGHKDVESIAQRIALVIVTLDELLGLLRQQISQQDDISVQAHELAALASPLVVYLNELCERLSVPLLCFSAEQFTQLITNYLQALSDKEDSVDALIASIVEPADNEWRKHYDDIMWDPVEAKRLAKEEDERKNREALAAKFAHIVDDPTKEEVEL